VPTTTNQPSSLPTALVASVAPTTELGCPAGWESQFGKCYLPYLEKKNYTDCLSTCTGLGATLPCVRNSEESLYLVNLYPNDLEFCAYIGLNDIATENTFQWQEGCSTNFTYFVPGEPNNYNEENCVSVCLRGDPRWNDLPCSFDTYCVCEKENGIVPADVIPTVDPTQIPTAIATTDTLEAEPTSMPSTLAPSAAPTNDPACPVGWVNNLGKCYLTTNLKKNYDQCLEICTNLGATLPCVMNAAENNYFASIFPVVVGNGMYLGLNDHVTEGDFQWQAGCASTYRNFLPGEPNSFQNLEDCVALYNDGRKMWNDMRCLLAVDCVCEKPASGTRRQLRGSN